MGYLGGFRVTFRQRGKKQRVTREYAKGEGGKRVVTRSLRVLCNRFARTKWVALYAIDTCAPDDRQRFLDRVEKAMLRL